MTRDYEKELASFNEVWKRVERAHSAPAVSSVPKLMPRREKKSAAVRFTHPGSANA